MGFTPILLFLMFQLRKRKVGYLVKKRRVFLSYPCLQSPNQIGSFRTNLGIHGLKHNKIDIKFSIPEDTRVSW